jgi:hypothetical protein
MSSLTNTVPFSLDEINLRKKLVFPDGTIQTTAYTGAVAGATLAEVLADGNDANFLSIDNLAGVTICDTLGTIFSSIFQSGNQLIIGSAIAGATPNSDLKLSVTTGAGLTSTAIDIAVAGVTIYPPVTFDDALPPVAPNAVQPASTDSSNKMPTTAWVQTAIVSRPAFVGFITNITPVAISNGYSAPTSNTVITLPTLASVGQYIIQFTISLEFAGTVDNPVCRESFLPVLGTQISGDYTVPYQYPNVDAIFSFLGTGVYISGSMVVNTLLPNVAGLVISLECAWTNSGTVTAQNSTTMVSYLGSA